MQINKDNIHENRHRVDYDYKVRDDVMLTNHTVYKYETPYKGSFVIAQCFTNGTVNLQYGETESSYNIRRINSCKYDTQVEDFNSKHMFDDVSI